MANPSRPAESEEDIALLENYEKSQKRRKRATLVCSSCRSRKVKCDRKKPSCTNCVKYGVACHYYDVLLGQRNVESDKEGSDDLEGPSRDELEKLKEKLKNANAVKTSTDIKLDLFERFRSLIVEDPPNEDNRPLNPLSLIQRDPYYQLYYIYILSSMSTNVNENSVEWYPIDVDAPSKWQSLLDMDDEDDDFFNAFERIAANRTESHQPLALSSQNRLKQQDLNDLKRQIIEALPPNSVLQLYLSFFWDHIWPLRPVIDREEFESQIGRIVKYDPISINLKQRSDLAIIATLLIILRYTYTAVYVMDENEHSAELTEIPAKAISIAQQCLAVSDVLTYSSLESLQALIFLRLYFRDSTEYGDGLNLMKSQNLSGFITQAAMTLGLNRDNLHTLPSAELNLKRRIWSVIVEIDFRSSVLSGSIPTIPHGLNNVYFPVGLSTGEFNQAQKEDLSKSSKLHKLYSVLLKTINESTKGISFNKLQGLLRETRDFVDKNYELSGFTSLDGIPADSETYTATGFENLMIFTRNIVQLMMEVQIGSSIRLYTEVNQHLNVDVNKAQFQDGISKLHLLSDLTIGYLLGNFKDRIPIHYNYEVYPLLTTSVMRIITFSISQLLRIYHAQESENDSAKKETLVDLMRSFSILIGSLLLLSKEKLAKKYYTALKVLASEKYGFKALKASGFDMIRTSLAVLENYKGNGGLTDGQLNYVPNKDDIFQTIYKEWTKADTTSSTKKTVLQNSNLHVSNMYKLVDEPFLKDCNQILKESFVHCPGFPASFINDLNANKS